MIFIWPSMLWSLLLIPVLAGLYFIGLERRKKFALRYSSLALVREAADGMRMFRRHLPPLCMMGAWTIMALGAARPTAELTLPGQQGVIILVIDISGSMLANDLQPTRMEAAKQAAIAFVKRAPSSMGIGVVAFSDIAFLVQAPTREHQKVVEAIAALGPQDGTAIGAGLVEALKAIRTNSSTENVSTSAYNAWGILAAMPNPPQSGAPGAIVLLTDGENTSGISPMPIAENAVSRKIPIYTVGIGSAEGVTLEINGKMTHTELDVQLLKEIAEKTGGTFSVASNANALRAVYETLGTRLVPSSQQTEITALFLGGAALLTIIAVSMSLLWAGSLL